MIKPIAGVVVLSFLLGASACADDTPKTQTEKGLWITCLGKSNVLGSREAMNYAVSFAQRNGFKKIFIQVYRGDASWFESKFADKGPFEKNRAAVKGDPLDVFIDKAHAAGLEVHAWLNTLTLSKNTEAKILKKYGPSVLTKDQYGRPSQSDGSADPLDQRYQREGQLFLEPGDARVKNHILGLVDELAKNYKKLDGIHFDYIRYPAVPPYLPGARFQSFGLIYGYGEENVKRFQEKTQIDPKSIRFEDALIWDEWRREQVTGLIREAASRARAANPGLKISAAVFSAFDRAYLAASQDWALWLEDGITDFVVLMNYSKDARYARFTSRSALGIAPSPKRIYVGLGAFLLGRDPSMLKRQWRDAQALRPGGIVLFDYDSIIEEPALLKAVEAMK